MTSQTQTQQKFFDLVLTTYPNLNDLSQHMRERGCSCCDLGQQAGLFGPTIFRGNPQARRMIIGEAPGKDEDIEGRPFVGPAGQLLDKIWLAAGWDINKDWYLTNVVKCRPIAPPGIYKQNISPTVAQKKACSALLAYEIAKIGPEIIVLVGKTAATWRFPQLIKASMATLAGTIHSDGIYKYFIIYHPAAILHSSNYPEKYTELRQKMWQDVLSLKTYLGETL